MQSHKNSWGVHDFSHSKRDQTNKQRRHEVNETIYHWGFILHLRPVVKPNRSKGKEDSDYDGIEDRKKCKEAASVSVEIAL